MASFENYDLANVKEMDFEPIPAGEYPAIITECVEKPTKDGSGKRLNLKVQIIDGKYQNRTMFDGLNTVNKSAMAQQIGRAQLKSICVALNKPNPKDSSELLNKALMIVVKIGKDQDGNPRSEIKGYKARLPTTPPVKQPEKNLVEQAFEKDPHQAAIEHNAEFAGAEVNQAERKNPYA